MFEALCHDIDKAINIAEQYGNNKTGIVIPVRQARLLSAFLKSCKAYRASMKVDVLDYQRIENADCLRRIIADNVVTRIIREAINDESNFLWMSTEDDAAMAVKHEMTMIIGSPKAMRDLDSPT